MADIRTCQQCSTVFVPRREHARFCCVRCRAAWNREHTGDAAAEASALQWSIIAMTQATGRLLALGEWDRPGAFAAIGDAVWWITLVDATLVRHHLDAYDRVLAGKAAAERRLIEGGLAGLRFVRNHIGSEVHLAGFIQPAGPGAGDTRVTSWTWKPVREPALASLAPRGQAWELTRYRAYQAHLAGHTIRETFGRTVTFLTLTAARPPSTTVAGAHPGW
jgi:hypothetical protein